MADNPRPSEHHSDRDGSCDTLAGVVEISPNKRYIRFEVIVAQTINGIQSSYKAFDTKNGIEVAWHHINLNALQESEQSRVTQVIQFIKNLHSINVISKNLNSLLLSQIFNLALSSTVTVCKYRKKDSKQIYH